MALVRARPKITAPFATGVWWDTACGHPQTVTTAAMAANTIYAMKLKIPRNLIITRVFCETTTAAGAGKLIRHGLYTVGADGLPAVLLYDTGNLAADAAAGDIGANIAMTLPYDEIWAATISDGTPTLRSYLMERTPQFMGWRTVVTNVTREVNVAKTQTFGALPDPFGTPTSYGSSPFRVGVKT